MVDVKEEIVKVFEIFAIEIWLRIIIFDGYTNRTCTKALCCIFAFPKLLLQATHYIVLLFSAIIVERSQSSSSWKLHMVMWVKSLVAVCRLFIPNKNSFKRKNVHAQSNSNLTLRKVGSSQIDVSPFLLKPYKVAIKMY